MSARADWPAIQKENSELCFKDFVFDPRFSTTRMSADNLRPNTSSCSWAYLANLSAHREGLCLRLTVRGPAAGASRHPFTSTLNL